MLLFEKRFIGVYCNRLYDLGKGMAPFHARAELKQSSAGKDVDLTNKNIKAEPANRQISRPLNSSFL